MIAVVAKSPAFAPRSLFLLRLLALIVTACLASSVALAQQIYKTVDEDGNVVYTDQKPTEDAEPIPLPELTVVDPVDLGNPSAAESDEREQRTFELTITSPLADEIIVNTGYRLDVEVGLDQDLPNGFRLVYLVDGEERLTSRSRSVTIEEVMRGPHTVQVELRTADGRPVATSEPVSFFMRQQSALYNRPG